MHPRRQWLESELARLETTQRYTRLPEIDGGAAAQRQETTLAAGQPGCWLSHLAARHAARESKRHLHVLEDDAPLSPLLFQVLEQMELELSGGDLLFTDACFHPPPSPDQFSRLQAARTAFLQRQKISLIDSRKLSFTGTNSYLVNHQSLERLGNLLADGWKRNQTIDAVLQQLVHAGNLRARLSFPIRSTAPKHEASTGGMRGPAAEALDAFRQAWFYAAGSQEICRCAVACRCHPESDPLRELDLNSFRSVLGSLANPDPGDASRALK